jgi:DNA-binding SARP family transcriptional activator
VWDVVGQGVQIDVCGSFAVTVDGRRREHAIRQQGRLVLGFLALHRSRPLSRDELELAVWGADSAGDHRAAISTLLSRLRRELGPGVIDTSARTTLKLADDVKVDYDEIAAALAQAERSPDHADPTAARRALRLADRGLMHGETAPWLDERRRELVELAQRARELIAEAALWRGGPELRIATDCAREIVKAEPYRESAYGLLIRALEAQGNVAQALEVYEQLRERLAEDLGATPGPQLRALHAHLLGAPGAAPAATPGAAGLSGLSSRSRAPFVGREQELVALRDLFGMEADGRCRLVLLEGEPGIGKTRLATQFGTDCQRRGALALYGRCDSDTVVPYQPFVEALRCAHADGRLAPLAEQIPAQLAELARVLPELGDDPRVAACAPAVAVDDRTERFRLFDAACAVFVSLSRVRPLLLILDDLHWADKATLLMLRQVVRSAGDVPILVLATYRDTERAGALLDTLADLRREHVLERISLAGLSEPAAAELIGRISHEDMPAPLSRTLWEECRGNPFFLEEMLRHRAPAGDRATIGGAGSLPDAVKDVIGRRLAGVSKTLRTVLEIACVAGNHFSLEIIESLADVSEDELDESLREAIEAHLIEELPGVYGRYSFEHSLTRQTLYEDLTLTRRARMHLRIGEELEALGDPQTGQRLAELAHHFLFAPPERGRAKAVHYAVCAARHAMQLLAYEEAVRHYEVALTALEGHAEHDERRHELLLCLGEAQVKAGDARRARVSFRDAGDIARAIGSAHGFARAALGAAQISGGVIDAEQVRRLEDALEWLGDDDEMLRARLLARLVIELSFARDPSRLARMSEEALVVARRCGDAGALSAALIARHWSLWAPENIAERLDAATELLALAARSGSGSFTLQGNRWRMMDLLELGEIAPADAALDAYVELAEHRRLPAELWYAHLYRAMRMLMSGRYEDAERASRAAFELGHRIGDPNAHQAYTLQMLALRRDVGGLRAVLDDVRANRHRYPAIPGWRCVQVHTLCELGERDLAAAEFADLSQASFAAIPRDGLWLGAMVHLAEVAAYLGDVEQAATLLELLAPFAERNVVVGWASTCLGSAGRVLAMLAAMLDREDEATRHFERAIAKNAGMGADPWVARTRVEYAGFLLDRGGSPAAVDALLEQASADAERLGMAPLRERTKELMAVRPA